MVEKEDNQIKITIFGQEYSVKAPADPTYIKKIAEYVDTKMREVQSGFSSTQSSNRIAILFDDCVELNPDCTSLILVSTYSAIFFMYVGLAGAFTEYS